MNTKKFWSINWFFIELVSLIMVISNILVSFGGNCQSQYSPSSKRNLNIMRLVILNNSLIPWPWFFWISQKPNLINLSYYTLNKNKNCHDRISLIFASSRTANHTKCAEWTWSSLEIIHRVHTVHDYQWPWVLLTWLLYNLQLNAATGADFTDSLDAFDQSDKG